MSLFAAFAAVVIAVVAPLSPPAQSDPFADLAWLLGEWQRPTRAGVVIERWERGDAAFVGAAFVQRGDDSRQTEALLLVEMAGEIYYIAKPQENLYPVAFRLLPGADGAFVFENTTHDFPQRIIYRRTAEDAMSVVIEGPGADGQVQQIELNFERRGESGR